MRVANATLIILLLYEIVRNFIRMKEITEFEDEVFKLDLVSIVFYNLVKHPLHNLHIY